MDDLTLVNRALNEIGQSPVPSLDNTTNNNTIATALLHLDPIKRATLRAADWNCARRRKALASVNAADGTNDSLGEWSKAYRLPPDCLAVRRFVSTERCIKYAKFSVEIDDEDKRVLYTNDGNSKIVYTGDLLDCNRWDSLLIEACMTALAIEFALAISRDTKAAMEMMKLYQGKIEIAG